MLTKEQFQKELENICGRLLTQEELAKTDKMCIHNWTLRLVADVLFGEDLVNEYFNKKLEKLSC